MKYLFLFALFVNVAMYAQETYDLVIPMNSYQVDTSNNIIICNTDVQELPELTSFDSVNLVLATSNYVFIENPERITHQSSYVVQQNGEEFTLFFSNIPLISIEASMPIVNEPKSPATFVYSDFEGIKTATTGIELRGGASLSYPKKTYDLEFWEDETGEDSKDMQFGMLREDDDWVLDALYNEPLRLRSHAAHQLWLAMHTLHYAAQEEEAKSGADVMHVDLFLNNEYRGIYMLSEQVDRKQLKVKKLKNNETRGELYKSFSKATGNARYEGLPRFDNTSEEWGGQELKYPDADEKIDWNNLYSFTEFVINAEVSEFHEKIGELLDIDNAIDYFIYLNIIRATDNTGKNMYTARYNQENPYFFVPWDVDGVFGTDWRGENVNRTSDILSNGLFDKLIHKTPTTAIATKATNRWNELRANVLSTESLNDRLTSSYEFLRDNKIYERENLVWQNYPYDQASKSYMDQWLSRRLQYLDSYFGETVLSTADVVTNVAEFTIFPNPASEFTVIKSKIAAEKRYAVYNIHGGLVLSGMLSGTSHKINTNMLPAGMYFFTMGKRVQKLLVK